LYSFHNNRKHQHCLQQSFTERNIYIEDTSIVIRKKIGKYLYTFRVMKRRAVTGGPINVENHSNNVTNPNGSEGKTSI